MKKLTNYIALSPKTFHENIDKRLYFKYKSGYKLNLTKIITTLIQDGRGFVYIRNKYRATVKIS